MTFKNLIKKMKKEDTTPCIVVANFIKDTLKSMDKEDRVIEDYNFLQGILWGLHAAGFISNDERGQMSDHLNNKLIEWTKR